MSVPTILMRFFFTKFKAYLHGKGGFKSEIMSPLLMMADDLTWAKFPFIAAGF